MKHIQEVIQRRQREEYNENEKFLLNVVGFKLFDKLKKASNNFKKVRLGNEWERYTRERGKAEVLDVDGNQLDIYFLVDGDIHIMEMDSKKILGHYVIEKDDK